MALSKEVSIAEKKKEVLDKIHSVVQAFENIRTDLLGILETSTQLNPQAPKEQITQETQKKLKSLLESIERLKQQNMHRTNAEIHIAHSKISQNIQTSIASIIHETRLRTIITISLSIQDHVQALGKNIKTGIGIEILALSNQKFSQIEKPLNLEKISHALLSQIKNINQRIQDIRNVEQVMSYLDLKEDIDILDELIDYILGGKTYDEIEKSLEKHGIIIEEITLLPLPNESDEIPVTPIPRSIIKNEEIIDARQYQGLFGKIHFFTKVLSEWLKTDRTIGWKQAKENIKKRG